MGEAARFADLVMEPDAARGQMSHSKRGYWVFRQSLNGSRPSRSWTAPVSFPRANSVRRTNCGGDGGLSKSPLPLGEAGRRPGEGPSAAATSTNAPSPRPSPRGRGRKTGAFQIDWGTSKPSAEDHWPRPCFGASLSSCASWLRVISSTIDEAQTIPQTTLGKCVPA